MDDIIPQKRCYKCKQTKPATPEFFNRNKRMPDGWNRMCRTCRLIDRPRKTPIPEPIPDGYKRCAKCKQIKPATKAYFYSAKSRCKQCCAIIAHNKWIATHPPVIIPDGYKKCGRCEQIKPATNEHFPLAKAAASGFASRCKACGIEYSRTRREVKSEYNRLYRLTNIEKELLRHREYERAHKHIRRAREKAVPGTYTLAQIKEQLKRQKYQCYYAACGFSKFPKVNGQYVYHVEHTFPLSRVVGTDIPANDISYLVLACDACNLSKGNKFPWEWTEGGRLL